MKKSIRQNLDRSKRRIERRLDRKNLGDCTQPVFAARNINYEIAARVQGISHGGIGLIQTLVQRLGLPEAINRKVKVLKQPKPYFPSDHVLTFAYNALCNGDCLEDIDGLRQDVNLLNALDARRIPDPTTAGDFCRRFQSTADIQPLQEVFDESRLKVWAQQPAAFFQQAIVDMDGHIAETTGECKQGMDISYDARWSYHPLLLTLANTGEVLRIVNRSGNRPSHEGAAEQVDQAVQLCVRGGFQRVLLRGDTDFSQTEHLDRWQAVPQVRFIFGYDNIAKLRDHADDLPETDWQQLERPPRYQVHTTPRQRPENVKDRIVTERGYEKLTLEEEHVAEFAYQPGACRQAYRMVVTRKKIRVEKGQRLLLPKILYFFYITNDRESSAAAIVFSANDRCNQENLIAQLSGGVRSLQAPVDNLYSNWAYMVMTSLAWNLKAWLALLLPEQPGPHLEKRQEEKRLVLTMEFKKFVKQFMRLPCQIVRGARRLTYRLLNWNPLQPIFFRALTALRC